MNPFDAKHSEPNYWLSCLLIDEDAMCKQVRGEYEALYIRESGKSCPTEILEKLAQYNAEGRPIWKPHAHATYLSDEWLCHPGRQWQGEYKCVYKWWCPWKGWQAIGCRHGYFP